MGKIRSNFKDAFVRLQNAGAEFGMIASNTPHMRSHSIRRGLEFPIVSILETTATAVVSMAGQRALVLGTPVTMNSNVYPDALEEYGVTAIDTPTEKDVEALRNVIDVDLYQGGIEGAAELILR